MIFKDILCVEAIDKSVLVGSNIKNGVMNISWSLLIEFFMLWLIFFLRHLEKLSDLFEKLRVSRTCPQTGTHFASICPDFINALLYLLYIVSVFMSLQKVEGRVASDQELKLTELLRYYMRDIQAAKVRHAFSSALFVAQI